MLLGVWGTIELSYYLNKGTQDDTLFLTELTAPILSALERCLFGCFWIPASVILTWACVASMGIQHAPFYYSGILFVHYLLFGLPLPSSFKPKHQGKFGFFVCSRLIDDSQFICGHLESGVATIAMIAFPSWMYASIHRATLFAISSPPNWMVISNFFVLVSLPWLLLGSIRSRKPLWWTGNELVASSSTVHGRDSGRYRKAIELSGEFLLRCGACGVLGISLYFFTSFCLAPLYPTFTPLELLLSYSMRILDASDHYDISPRLL